MKEDTGLASEVLKRIPNKYMAVIVSAKRTRALNDGARSLVKVSATKPTTVALEEIAAGYIAPDTEKPEMEIAQADLLPPPDDTTDTDTEPESASEPQNESEEEAEDEAEPESEEG